jgi:hypothetical protein
VSSADGYPRGMSPGCLRDLSTRNDYTMKASSSSTTRDQTVVQIELIGTLRHSAGRATFSVDIASSTSLATILLELEDKHCVPRGTLLEEGSNGKDLRRDLLVLVDGREIGILNGPATLLNGGELVTLLPVSHGG